MPLETRGAMLHAIASEPIIVGAYSDRDGGVCPMLAAHRNGGRTRRLDEYERALGELEAAVAPRPREREPAASSGG